MKLQISKKLDYLFPFFVWLAIFWKNIFSHLLFVDYIPPEFFDTPKLFYISNFSYVFNPLDILKLLFSILNLLQIYFQFSILISMTISYFYIKKIFKNNLSYSLLFTFVYFFNPFVYNRIMIGHLGILVSYFLIPVFLYYLFNFIKSFNKKSLIELSISTTLVSLFAVHFFIINLIIFFVALIFLSENRNLKKIFLFSALFIFLLILLNLFWIQGVFFSGIFSAIDQEHEIFFSPKSSSNIPAVTKIIGMWGFWRENAFITTYKSLPLIIWYVLTFLIVLIMLTGYISSEDKKESRFFFTLFWIGVLLATGISHPYTKPIFSFLFEHFPFFNGFRDSHKFVSLIVLSYAYFVPSFFLFIKNKFKKLSVICLIFTVVLFIFFSFPLLGLWNQQKSLNYPKDYYLGDFLKTQNISSLVIYLPWQQYLTYNWTKNLSSDGRISVPINRIIKEKVIIGADEFGNPSYIQKNIKKCLENKNLSCLEAEGVQYILKDKCAIFPDYDWIKNPIYENQCLSIYKLNPKKTIEQKIPVRFFLFTTISFITLFILIILRINNNLFQKDKYC